MDQQHAANKTVMAWIADIGSDQEYTDVEEWVIANRKAFNVVADTTLYSVAANGTVVRNAHNIASTATQHWLPCG
jgi:hypothetical protein